MLLIHTKHVLYVLCGAKESIHKSLHIVTFIFNLIYASRVQKNGCLMWQMELPGMIEMFYIFVEVLFTWVFILVKILIIEFTICEFHFNKKLKTTTTYVNMNK